MKTKPTTPEECFEAARTIIASHHYKIFTPNGRFFRQEYQFIAATAFGLKRLFLFQLRKSTLTIQFLPPNYEDPKIISILQEELGVAVDRGKPLIRLTRDDPWDARANYVSPRDRREFDMLITPTIDARRN